ncbi:MAG: DUF4097 family beta strand repeat protein [Oscillospiraceae bacterium]|nr:DUF4097 family beta strand repeat protein [Oscillospiraceae bacterium]
MKTSTKTTLFAAVLVVAGIILCTISVTVLGFVPGRDNVSQVSERTYDVDGSFRNISIGGDTDDITLAKSSDGKCKAVCMEPKDTSHNVSVNGDTLEITYVDERGWQDKYFMNGMISASPSITLYLTEDIYESLKIVTDTGDITVPDGFTFTEAKIDTDTGEIDFAADLGSDLEILTHTGHTDIKDITAERITIESSTGSQDLEKISCTDISITTSTGDVDMKDVVASGNMRIKTSTGDVEFDGCDAADIKVETSTGEVEGTLLTEKVFVASSNSGDIKVPDTDKGGRCEIRTSTGDIEISIK